MYKNTWRIDAQDWDDYMRFRFGEKGSMHKFSDRKILRFIEEYGPARIRLDDMHYNEIYFENG